MKQPTRRDVVKMAGAASAAVGPFIQKVKAANDQVQYGFIGTGSRGSYLLGHLAKIDNGRCVAVCDLDPEHAAKGADVIGTNPQKFKDYRELLAAKNVDAVLIAVPLFEHFRVTKDALEAGKHVFCEKSLVFKPEEVHAPARAGRCASEAGDAGGPAAPLQQVLSGRERHGDQGRAGRRETRLRAVASQDSAVRRPGP